MLGKNLLRHEITHDRKGDLVNIQALIQAGASLNSRSTRSKHTMMHMAAAEGQLGVVQYLLDQGAEVDIVDRCDSCAY